MFLAKLPESVMGVGRLFSRLNSDTLKPGGMYMPGEIKITTVMLLEGALFFALVDAVYVPFLAWQVSKETFQRLKWPLALAAAAIWYGIWFWAIGYFWETVYRYVFPAWAQTWIPWIAFVAAAVVALVLWALALKIKGKPVLIYCLSGGALGSLTHIWAVYRGIVTKPPMLQGASPVAAVVIAFFEYMFYWCTILLIAKLIDWGCSRFRYPKS
jgi:hypothetical protein